MMSEDITFDDLVNLQETLAAQPPPTRKIIQEWNDDIPSIAAMSLDERLELIDSLLSKEKDPEFLEFLRGFRVRTVEKYSA